MEVCQGSLLINRFNSKLSGFCDGQVLHFLSIEIDFATVWLIVASDDLDERGLASTVIAYQSHNFIMGDGKVDLVQGLNFPETLRDIPHFKYVIHQTISFCETRGQTAPNVFVLSAHHRHTTLSAASMHRKPSCRSPHMVLILHWLPQNTVCVNLRSEEANAPT